MAINQAGQVAGNSAPAPAQFNHAFLWSRGQRIDLGALPPTARTAAGPTTATTHGWIVGASDVPGGDFHAVLWR